MVSFALRRYHTKQMRQNQHISVNWLSGNTPSDIFGDCYILPSSIHEVLIVPSDMDVNTLAHMVHDINRAEVAEQDRLSDHVFRLSKGVISVAA